MQRTPAFDQSTLADTLTAIERSVARHETARHHGTPTAGAFAALDALMNNIAAHAPDWFVEVAMDELTDSLNVWQLACECDRCDLAFEHDGLARQSYGGDVPARTGPLVTATA